ncbi:MAG: bifunctional transaldolase/phosoglucose isomerase [Candidatus Promineifilaceae bacterium]|nr:bifunctional transaldolase/phosoglucose isomerase [Candidatus Promineifilaceae bacterium]
MSKVHDLAELGQSMWLDYIRRAMLDEELSALRTMGVRGVTSNPSIFQKAIVESDDYDDDLRLLASEGASAREIYEALVIEDIQRAADEFDSLYYQTEGVDGYVSLEVNPNLAHDTEATVAEARRLFARVDRPNVYIKVPATPAGIPAIEQLIGDGVNVNVTLIFSLDAYTQVAEAYIAGLERFDEEGGDLSGVNSVASFFVSRVDSKVDPLLEDFDAGGLEGAIGIANAKLAYQRFQDIFSGERWEALQANGAHVQRPLWASTSTKNPAYPETYYVDNLIGPYTVNTVPPRTLEAFLESGTVETTLTEDVDEAEAALAALAELGISMGTVTDELLAEGVEKFAVSFNSLMESIALRRAEIRREARKWDVYLGDYGADVDEAWEKVETDNVLERIYEQDYTVWAEEPEEITNRLGWLTSAEAMQEEVSGIEAVVERVRAAGLTDVVLLGMGGSSLAPEMFARTFGPAPGYLKLTVLDSTDPEAISALRMSLDPQKTLFVVSSKSGSTVETLSFFTYFYNWLARIVGEEQVGDHFIAITDPGSRLAEIAEKYNFRAHFLSDPNIGGRYSALSPFGLVPAALLGVDVRQLLERGMAIMGPEDAEQAAWLGVVLGTLARAGRNRLTLITSPELASFGDWAEQLIAESTGKAGTGILPVVNEPPLDPAAYGQDRIFVYLRLAPEVGDADGAAYDEKVEAIADAGFPLITMNITDHYDLAEQFVIWQIATAVASAIIGVHPFNQPNVEAAKVRARMMMEAYQERGMLPDTAPRVSVGGIDVHEHGAPADSPDDALATFLEYAQAGGYIAVQAYIAPNEANDRALTRFRSYLRAKSGLPVTVGYGPRFLHSTGQLHKGDEGHGLFIQLTTEPLQDLPIPDAPGTTESSITFGVLKMAQALGDAQALQEAGRRVIRFHLRSSDVPLLLAELMRR